MTVILNTTSLVSSRESLISAKPSNSPVIMNNSNSKKSSICDNMAVGRYPYLWNKDGTRYAGKTLIPKCLLEVEDYNEREAAIVDFQQTMLHKPLTAEEKQQKAEWNNLVFGSGPFEPLDDDMVDAAIAWSQGRGKFPE